MYSHTSSLFGSCSHYWEPAGARGTEFCTTPELQTIHTSIFYTCLFQLRVTGGLEPIPPASAVRDDNRMALLLWRHATGVCCSATLVFLSVFCLFQAYDLKHIHLVTSFKRVHAEMEIIYLSFALFIVNFTELPELPQNHVHKGGSHQRRRNGTGNPGNCLGPRPGRGPKTGLTLALIKNKMIELL